MDKKTRGLLLSALCLTFIAVFVACAVEYDPIKGKTAHGKWSGTKDGEFTATATGSSADGAGTVTATITLKDGIITKVKLSGTGGLNSGGYGDTALAAAPGLILALNGDKLDTLSGATKTTDAINSAVADALTKALGIPTYSATKTGSSFDDGPGTVTVEIAVQNGVIISAKATGTGGLASYTPSVNLLAGAGAFIVGPPNKFSLGTTDVVSGATATRDAINLALTDVKTQAGL
jgi:uncharacterized protein with FMN-binding domain